MVNYRHAQTQHGNSKLNNEENIIILASCHSPSPNDQELISDKDQLVEVKECENKKFDEKDKPSENENEINLIDQQSFKDVKKLETQNNKESVWFYDCELSNEAINTNVYKKNETQKSNLPNTEKRKVSNVDNYISNTIKKSKLDSKELRDRRPGFADDRYDETSYYLENGLRKVYPYYFTFTTFTKGRWIGEKIIDVFSREFRAHPAEEYERNISTGSLTVNYEKVTKDYILKHNDLLSNTVHRHEVPVTSQSIQFVEINEDMVVVNKPASIPVHPCGRYRHNTVIFILAKEYNLKNLRTIHRLDRLTSGILLFGRNLKTAREIEVQIRNRDVKKQYISLVEGEFPDGVIECKEPIEIVSYKIGVCKVSSNGKDCITKFEKLNYDGKVSTVLCKPLTGRMHQIRVHLQYLGYPIVNDPLYNHEVFGPKKGKGGDLGGKSDDELVKDLIRIHNAENWLGVDGGINLLKSSTNSFENNTATNNQTENKNSKLETINQENIDLCNPEIQIETTNSHIENQEITKINVGTQTGHVPPDMKYDPIKITKCEHCYECKFNFCDPKPQDLIMYLHAWKYEGPNWKYETELPNWAKCESMKLKI